MTVFLIHEHQTDAIGILGDLRHMDGETRASGAAPKYPDTIYFLGEILTDI